MFAVVRFLDENNAPGIVCSHWINREENACRYPNVKTNEAKDKLVRILADPDLDWSSCRIKISQKYNSFNLAKLHLRQTEDISDLESEDEIVINRPRKRRKTRLVYLKEKPDIDCISQKNKRKANNDTIPYSVSRKDSYFISNSTSQNQPVPSPPSISHSTINQNQPLPSLPSISLSPINRQVLSDESDLECEDEIVINRPQNRINPYVVCLKVKSDTNCTSQSSTRKMNNDTISYTVSPKDSNSTSRNQSLPSLPSISLSPINHQTLSEVPDSQLEKPACSSNQTKMNEQLVVWMTDISRKFKQLESKIDQLLENQSKLQLQHQVPIKVERDENLEILGSLPVHDDSSFIELNMKISKESHLRHLLINILISVGGKDMRSYIHNMLRRIISDEVGELYSLKGKSMKSAKKKSFLDTEVSKTIFYACQRLFKEMATDVKIREAVGDWLNQSKVRKIRRIQRHEKKLEEECIVVQ